MSDHRRKPPQSKGGRRAAGRRRAAPPPPSGRRSAPPDAADPLDPGRARRRRARAGAAAAGGRRGGPAGGRARRRAAAAGRWSTLVDYPRSGRYGWRRWLPSGKQTLGACVAFSGTLIALLALGYLMVGIPDANAAALSQKNVYYWDDGSRMVVSGGGTYNREVVQLSEIPRSMQNAVVSAENATFWTDSGVDPQGIARAVVKMAQGGETQSGSTITQQYVKNTYLDQSQTLTRKLKEILISVKVGAEVPKSDILAGYLNTGYFGRGAYGIQAAAQAYYGVNCDQLNPSQSAFLAGLLNGPNVYDPAGGVGPGATPAENLKRGTARWSWILDREVDTHDLTPAQRARYTAFPMPLKPRPATVKAGQIGYLTDLADNYVTANTGITRQQLDRGGFQIYTTFDRKDVAAMAKAVAEQSKTIDPKRRPKTDSYVQFGGASVVPADGAIKAVYGGDDYLDHFTDNADYTGAQVGSTFKPYVLAAAMQYGVRSPHDPPDQPDSDRTPVSPDSMYPGRNMWKVLNYDGTVWTDSKGRQWLQPNDESDNFPSITLRYAMQQSVNSTYVQLGMDVGLDKVKQSALAAGVPQDSLASPNVPSFSIGTSSPSAIRMAAGYATFAAHGVHADPYSVTRVEQSGVVRYRHHVTRTVAYPAQVADTVTNVLQSVVQKGTGTVARQLGRPAAGKTGTTDSNKSAWFTGYTPQLATSIGMFRMNSNAPRPVFLPMYGVGGNRTIFGASYPTQIWTAYMKAATSGQPVEQFAVPTPFGSVVDAHGATPTPSPSITPSTGPSGLPSTGPTLPGEPLPGPTACGIFGCAGTGGAGPGGGAGGPGTGPGQTPAPAETAGPGTEPGGGNQGWFDQ